jgi:hypothetical protein
MARNRALAACDSEVLALVEDDVTVEPRRSVPDIRRGVRSVAACAGRRTSPFALVA